MASPDYVHSFHVVSFLHVGIHLAPQIPCRSPPFTQFGDLPPHSVPPSFHHTLWSVLDSLGGFYKRCVYIAAESDLWTHSEGIVQHFSERSAPALRTLKLDLRLRGLDSQRSRHTVPLRPIFNDHIPLLRSFSLIGSFVLYPTPSFYSRLSHLVVGYQLAIQPSSSDNTLAPEEWVDVLGSMSALVSLDLHRIRCSPSNNTLNGHTLSRLTHVRLSYCPTTFYPVLGAFRLPALETLVYIPETPHSFKPLLSSCDRLLWTVLSVELDILHLRRDSPDVLVFFDALQNIRRLDIRHVLDSHFDAFWTAAVVGRCPQLQWIFASVSPPSDSGFNAFFDRCSAPHPRVVLPFVHTDTVGPALKPFTLSHQYSRALGCTDISHCLYSPLVDFWSERSL
ncbi:hypothetical protein C8R45DRAFT_1087662 [Mycena sanguinolenta]|nr:hypothetical protein C8R45DRAFT_1087662 [Mycena sanguinolenta]